MSKESEIMREHIRTHRTVLSMCDEPEDVILNRLLDDFDSKDNRIAELEEQLKNAIVPKFKKGDKVYAIIDTFAYTDVFTVEIRDNHLFYEVWDGQDITKQHFTRIFTTKEEAEARLGELQENEKID